MIKYSIFATLCLLRGAPLLRLTNLCIFAMLPSAPVNGRGHRTHRVGSGWTKFGEFSEKSFQCETKKSMTYRPGIRALLPWKEEDVTTGFQRDQKKHIKTVFFDQRWTRGYFTIVLFSIFTIFLYQELLNFASTNQEASMKLDRTLNLNWNEETKTKQHARIINNLPNMTMFNTLNQLSGSFCFLLFISPVYYYYYLFAKRNS